MKERRRGIPAGGGKDGCTGGGNDGGADGDSDGSGGADNGGNGGSASSECTVPSGTALISEVLTTWQLKVMIIGALVLCQHCCQQICHCQHCCQQLYHCQH